MATSNLVCPKCGNRNQWRDMTMSGGRITATCAKCNTRVTR